MEPTQALNFNIPKLKRQVTKDNLFEIDLTSRDAKELLDSVSRTYLDQKYSGPWRVKSVNMVRNTELEQDYKAKRTDMKEEGRHNRELVDQIAFCAIKEPPYITKIAKNGMMTNNLPFSIIGEHKSGVYLTKHADVQLKMVETISSQTITALFVFNTMLGKCKAINERIMSNADPTPNYDSHIPLQPAQPSDTHIVQLQRSQIYLYEYDNDGMPAARPRQCLPHAVITYEKVENFTMGPLKSIYCYDPAKGSSQPKKFDDKADWKKAPRNMATPQLPFAKNTPPLDNPLRPTLPFGSLSAALGQARDILGAMTQATFNSDAPRDFEAGGPNQCGILASNLLLNYAQQMSAASTGSIDGQGVMVHRSGSDPRRRFLPDETMASTDQQQQQQQQQQQRIFPQMQGFPDFQRASGMGFSFLNNDQNMDSGAGAPWEPQPPLGFYSECDSTDKLSQPWHNSSYFNNNNNNIGNNNNNFNNSNFYDNNNFNNNNSNNLNNNNNDNNNENQCGMFGWFDPGFGSFESDEAKRQKLGNTNCDNQSSSGPSSSSSSSGGAKKKSIPFALNKKKPPTAVTPGGATPPQQQPKPKLDDPPNKTGKKDPWCADTNQKTKTKTMTSDLDSKPTSAKLSESGSKIPFPKKTPVVAPTDNEAGQIEGSRSENSRKMEDLFKKLFQTECKRNFGNSLLEWNLWDNKKNSKIQEFTNEQNVDKVPPPSSPPPPSSSILTDVSETELKNFEEFLKEKIKLSKTENETPKIKTSLASLNQGLKTTILLPSKNRNEDVPQLEDLKKLLGIVESALESKTQATVPQWVESYQSFLKRVQKKELTPGQHHKWVRKKEEPPPEPPPPDKIPPPMAEVSIEDVVNTKLMKELLLEQELSESTSVSEADSLYLPPSERKKRKTGGAGSSLATRRQTKKKAPFDMTSYRRRRKRQKMQRKAAAAAEFDNCSLASTTSSFGLSDNNGFGFWGADFKDFDLDPSFNDDLPLCSQETIKREATLTDLGFDDWKDALLSLKFQPVVVLKDCVRQITSHLQQEGSSNLMEWIGNPNELLETLNFPPNHSPVAHSSSSSSSSSIITTSTSMSTTPSSSSSTSITTTTTPSSTPKPGPIPKTGGTKPPAMSKSVSKTKPSKPNPNEFQPTSETISINSIKASVKSEITKGKKFSKKNLLGTCGGTGGTVSKKKVAKPKTPSMEIPRIKPKLPEKASAAKVDPSSQLFSTIFKDVRKPTPPSLAPTHPAPSTLAAKTNPSTINKTGPPRGIIKNTRGDVATPKVPIVSPASFPPTDQSLKVDLLMESISTPPTASAPTTGPPPTTGAPTAVLPSESEQKKLTAEQRKVAEQKKQKISFQAYMEKHIKTKPARSPPREKTNVFESLKDIFPGNSESPTKPVTEPSGTAAGATAAAPSVSLPAAIPPILDKLKPTLLMPPVTGTFTNSVFSPISPPLQIPRDPRVPSKLPLPFVKDPPLPKIIPTAPKVAKEDLKPILKGKQPLKSPSSSVSHRKAPPLPKTIPTSITIPLEELNEPSHAPVDPRLSRKAAPTQPDLHPTKEPSSKASSITDPLLTRDPRLLKMYGEVPPDVGRSEKPPLQDALSDAFGFLKKPDLNNEGVSDIIGKSKPILKNNTWNLFSIQTGDDDDDDDGTPTSQQPQGSATKKPSTKIIDLPVYAQFSTDVPKDTKPVQTSTDSRKSDQPKPDTPEVVKGRPAWGFYREMSPKMPGSEDANPTADGDLNPSETEDKKDENSASNAAGASDSPQVLYFSDSDSNSNEDLTKPLYIDESATGRTPRRDPFENYKFNLKSPEHGLKKSSSTNADPKKASNMKPESDPFNTLKDHVKRDTTGVDIYGSNFGGGSSESLDQKLSPFNETVPPADPDSKNPSSSSLFCAYQMTGKTELKDTSHIWMKSLSTLSQAKAVSSLNISDEVLNVLRKVVKENIPAGQKDGSSSKESNAKELHKPGTLSKDYKLEGLDKDLFKSTNLDLELSTAEDSTAHSESFGSNAYQQKSSKKVPEENFKSKRESSESHKGHSGAESVKAEAWVNPDHTSKMCNPSIDETSKNLPLDYPKTEDFSQGQAIPVLSGKKLGPFHKLNKKSRSLSPTVTTVSSATHYLQPNTTWLGHQTPFWTGINQKIDGIWRNLAPFNPIVTTSHPTPPIWPPPINMPPSILANIPFPVGFMPPDLPLPHPSLNQTDSFRPSNLVDWFADKINPKGDNPVPDYGSAKAHTDPHGELVTNFLDSISSTPKSDSTSEADQSSTKPATTSSSNTDKKSVQNNPDGSKIKESEGSSELTSTNSKADPERSGSSVYSSTDKTSEIASGSAIPLDPSTSSGTTSIPKTSSKESAPSLKRTLSIESLSGGSQVLKGDPLKKPEKKKIKLDLSSLTTSSIREDSKSKEGDCKKSDPVDEKSEAGHNKTSGPKEPETSEERAASGESTSKRPGATNTGVSGSEETKKEANGDCKKSRHRPKSLREERSRKKSGETSSGSPKSGQVSSLNSKSLNDIRLGRCNREQLKKLMKGFLKKSDLQSLLESVKKIKKELASQPSDEKERPSEKRSDRKTLASPSGSRPGSEEKSSSSRTKKSSEKISSDRLWKPVKSLEETAHSPATSSSSRKSDSARSKSSGTSKRGSSSRHRRESSTKNSKNTERHVSTATSDKQKRSSEANNGDSELEEGELPDDESDDNEDPEVRDEQAKHRTSKWKTESGRRRRQQSERRHGGGSGSHDERSYKRRLRQSMSDDEEHQNQFDAYDRGDSYPYGPMDDFPRDRMEGYPHGRMDCYPMDNSDGYPGNPMDYPRGSPDECPPDRTGFYPPPSRMDMDSFNPSGRPDDFMWDNQRRFQEKQERDFRGGNFSPYHAGNPGGPYWDESNNYPDSNFNDYGPDGDRYPRGRPDRFPYENPDFYRPDNCRPSLDPEDYIMDETDGLLYEKTDEFMAPPPQHPNAGYPRDWPGMNPHGKRAGSYSPGREENCYWSDLAQLRKIKIEVRNNGKQNQKGAEESVSREIFAAEDRQNEARGRPPDQSSYGDSHNRTEPKKPSMFNTEEDDKKMRDTFDTINDYLRMFVKEGSARYKILKKSLGVPLETRFDTMSKTKRKKIRKKIQSQLQALKQAAPSIGNQDRATMQETDSTRMLKSENPQFKIEDFQNFPTFEGNLNSMEHLKNWLNRPPDTDPNLHSRSSSEARDDSEDDANQTPNPSDDVKISDPNIRRAVQTVIRLEKSPGFGTPHQRVPLNLLLAEEKDNLFSFEGCFLILMRKIPRKAVERLVTLREVLNFLTCELQAAQKANDMPKYCQLRDTKNKLHDRRKDVLEKFTGTINVKRLQTIREAKMAYEDCLEYLKKKPDPPPKIDKGVVVKSIKAIQGHINMTKKFLDESSSNSSGPPLPPHPNQSLQPPPPHMSSMGFCPDMPGPNQPPDVGWSWMGLRNLDNPIPGCYNNPPWNNPGF